MLSLWTALFLRSAMILAGADILCRFPRHARPAFRHRILLFAFALLFVWPLLAQTLPSVPLPLWFHVSPIATVTVRQNVLFLHPHSAAISAFSPARLWAALWGIGALIALAPVVSGHIQIFRLSRRAKPLQDSIWLALSQELCRELGIVRIPQLLTLPAPLMPLAFGLLQPRILLPACSLDWSLARRRSVLLHELAHVKRRDILSQLFASFVCAVWWFQPLSWWCRLQLRRESERACDELVLASGIRPSDYAAELLEIARSFRIAQRWSAAAITMARRGELESRLNTILDPPSPVRTKSSFLLPLAILTLVSITASAVTVSPQSQTKPIGGPPMKRTILSGLLASAGLSAATISGSLFDPNGAAISDAKASLYNPDNSAKQQTATSPDGKFLFESLPAGQYILRIEKPGYAALLREFNVEAESKVDRGLMLKLDNSEQQGNDQVTTGQRPAFPQQTDTRYLRVSGDIEQSNLIKKVQPVYPTSAKAAGLQGTVLLDLVISAEGVPQEIRVISSPGDDLTESSLEAVRQWRYKPTLLNGSPVAVVTEVTVNYTLTR